MKSSDRIVSGLIGAVAVVVTTAAFAKGEPPVNPACAGKDVSRSGWEACLGKGAALDDAELFFAGYWLARTGEYARALEYLRLARNPDARIHTYIGFATRKLGDTEAAFPHYRRALELDPDYVVARAYLGEAYLASGDVAAAQGELLEIGRRCGQSCSEYAELASAIASFRR